MKRKFSLFIPGFLLLLVCLGIPLAHVVRETRGSNRLPVYPKSIQLPKPTGPFAIGTVIYNWTDMTRDDIVSAAPGNKRQLLVQIWYPAQRKQGLQTAPYLPEFTVLRSTLARFDAFKEGVDQLAEISTNALLQAGVARQRRPYPVIIFSHGTGTPRSFYTSMMEELASQGYIVAGIDHPYMGVVAINGGVVMPYAGWTQPPPGGLASKSDEERDQYWRTSNEQLSADQTFVLNQLEELNKRDPDKRFKNRLDSKHVGMMGHSQGFVSRSCGTDERFTACVNLDGVPALAERRNGFSQPFMTIRDGDDSPRATTIYANLRNVGYDVLINGAGHNSYIDLPLLATYNYKLDGVHGHRIIDAYLLAFFDTYLQGKASSLLGGSSVAFPEVVLTIHQPKQKISG